MLLRCYTEIIAIVKSFIVLYPSTKTISIMMLIIMTFRIMTLAIKTGSRMTISIRCSILDTKCCYAECRLCFLFYCYPECSNAECLYIECHCADCRDTHGESMFEVIVACQTFFKVPSSIMKKHFSFLKYLLFFLF
jgi:hypothetical protein